MTSEDCQIIINEIKLYIQQHAAKELISSLENFAERYFQAVAFSDLRKYAIPALYHILLSHWQFCYERKPGDAKVRIFNPVFSVEGFATPHTVIQISHDDIPFLVDSIRMAINHYGLEVHFIIHFGGLKVRRDAAHRIVEIVKTHAAGKDIFSEAPIFIEIDKINDKKLLAQLLSHIQKILGDVRLAVADWQKMLMQVEDCLFQLEKTPPNLNEAELIESRDFLRWIINNNFTFLGCRDYKLIGNGKTRALQLVPGSGLGVLRDESESQSAKSYADLPPQARKMALSADILIIAKTNTISTVHRRVYTDYIGVKRFNSAGELIGERRFIGLYTSVAYHSSPRAIPLLRHKVEKVLASLGFPSASHDGKESLHILETLPRDDLFQASYDELRVMTLHIIQLKERKRIKLLIRRDAFYRYFSCLVYVPRELFTTELALAMQEVLMSSLKGLTCNFTTYFSESVLARLYFQVRVNPKVSLEYDPAEIEKKLISVSRSWADDFKDQLIERYDEEAALKYFAHYAKSLPSSYMERYSPAEALADIEKIESLVEVMQLGMLFVKSPIDNTLNIKLFHLENTIALSDVLPIFENMGLRVLGESPHQLKFKNGKQVWINDFNTVYAKNANLPLDHARDMFEEAFKKIWVGEVENDGFNRLVIECHLRWQEVAMLRAYTKYLRQTGFTFSQNYIEAALVANGELTQSLVELFALRFNPDFQEKEKYNATDLLAHIDHLLDNVASLDEDRIIRRLLEIILATLRTNYYQKDKLGKIKPYLAIKLNPAAISDLPLPRPKYEIFVYSPKIEGVHLRAGEVARGGLRWSDRREDFRTEVLGLMKAQQVKNTVIVPEGAKGGFVLKNIPSDLSRDEYFKEGINGYSIFISALLDITDNIHNGNILPPPNVVRHDDDDPYLVVAADKGTATFSDIANSIAQSYGFWMDDAFASGGSAGYDHKKMGITSRGVWVSVKRHFRELGRNPANEDFTVMGIGDMAGDVFGNGMLLSQHIRLLAAFNHQHIFVDPNPHAASSFIERQRLFDLPRSSWSDYNPALISPGGGIFSRNVKSIKLSKEMQVMLGTNREQIVPNELIRSLLTMQVDLIWNGGIGTFVKASSETHLDVGDRTNDNIRIDGNELNALMIAEGGNLGMTQLARVEYSLAGGIVNTDFIDNSAGVDCSDHEVNIKILFNRLIANGLMTKDERNVLLEQMTTEVADLVLLDNYDQTQMLSLEASVSEKTMDLFSQYMNGLEKRGELDRKLEFLPDEKSLGERKATNKPFTRPEIAMLLAYSKMYLKRDIISSDIPDEPYFNRYLATAFPKLLSEKYAAAMQEHSLKREIISTQLCKSITDKMGINFVERLHRETGATMPFIIRCYVVASGIFSLETLWQKISLLDETVNQSVQQRMMLQLYYLIRRATRWLVRNRRITMDMQQTIDEFQQPVNAMIDELPYLLDPLEAEVLEGAISSLTDEGVPRALALQISSCNTLFTALDIIEASQKYHLSLAEVAKTYYQLGNRLDLNWVRAAITNYGVENPWEELAKASFRDDLDRVQRKLCARVLLAKESKTKSIGERIDYWMSAHPFLLERWSQLMAEVKSSDTLGFVAYSVILRELFDFAQAA